MHTLYLASGSPRRRELLTQIGVPFTALGASIDETPLPNEAASAYVERLARGKALAGLAQVPGAVVLGADTCVVRDSALLGKPRDPEHGQAMLLSLAGREHEVVTAVALAREGEVITCCVASKVRFGPISAAQARAYWASGEPADKAGAYAIQGLGAVFVERIDGSYSSVVGLPLCETARLLARMGIACWQR